MNPWLKLRLFLHSQRHGGAMRLGSGTTIESSLCFGFPHSSIDMGNQSYFGRFGTLTSDGGSITFGDHAKIDQFWVCKMHLWQPGGLISVGNFCRFEAHVHLTAFRGGKLLLGSNVFVGRGSVIACHQAVKIGDCTAIAEYVSIRDHEHVPDGIHPIHTSPLRLAPIHIGSHVWIGAKATITAGISIGDGAVVGANAVVTHDIPAGGVVGGVPARPLQRTSLS